MCMIYFYNTENNNSVDHLYEDFEPSNLITPAVNDDEVRTLFYFKYFTIVIRNKFCYVIIFVFLFFVYIFPLYLKIIEEKMISVKPDTENLRPAEIDKEDKDIYEDFIPADTDPLVQTTNFNEQGLYGLLILPILGVGISTVVFLARRYQVYWLLRIFNCIHRLDRPENESSDFVDTELSTFPSSNPSSNDESSQHLHFLNDIMEYDPSMSSSSNDILFMDVAVQTSNHEISIAEPENFNSDDEIQNLSSLDEDKIIYLNISEIKMNEDIIASPATSDQEETPTRSVTRSGKVYKCTAAILCKQTVNKLPVFYSNKL